jgi:hypothetical protein
MVVEDILGMGFVHPGAVDAAGRATVGPVAALDFGRTIHLGVQAEFGGHGSILPVLLKGGNRWII